MYARLVSSRGVVVVIMAKRSMRVETVWRVWPPCWGFCNDSLSRHASLQQNHEGENAMAKIRYIGDEAKPTHQPLTVSPP